MKLWQKGAVAHEKVDEFTVGKDREYDIVLAQYDCQASIAHAKMLAKIGLITPAFLKKYRKHALVFVLIIAAIITPPDVASQIIVSIPVLILYEISIKVAAIVIKRQQKNAK